MGTDLMFLFYLNQKFTGAGHDKTIKPTNDREGTRGEEQHRIKPKFTEKSRLFSEM